jgi:hypothetical protein
LHHKFELSKQFYLRDKYWNFIALKNKQLFFGQLSKNPHGGGPFEALSR